MKVLEARNLSKSYLQGTEKIDVLKDVSLEIAPGACLALLGASGSGKSTLLHILGLIDEVDQGEVLLWGQATKSLKASQKARLRLERLGFIFQFHHLIPELTALENTLLPATLLGHSKTARAKELLDWVGLSSRVKAFPWQMSGGEQQRVAIVRALINEPKLLLTDEATGNLDRARAVEIVDLLLEINRELGTTILSVTHDEELAQKYHQRIHLKEGRLS